MSHNIYQLVATVLRDLLLVTFLVTFVVLNDNVS